MPEYRSGGSRNRFACAQQLYDSLKMQQLLSEMTRYRTPRCQNYSFSHLYARVSRELLFLARGVQPENVLQRRRVHGDLVMPVL